MSTESALDAAKNADQRVRAAEERLRAERDRRRVALLAARDSGATRAALGNALGGLTRATVHELANGRQHRT